MVVKGEFASSSILSFPLLSFCKERWRAEGEGGKDRRGEDRKQETEGKERKMGTYVIMILFGSFWFAERCG